MRPNVWPYDQPEQKRPDAATLDKNDGGPAFPLQSIGPEFAAGYAGMTLRDYFAAAVLQSIVRNQDNKFHPQDDAEWAYSVADAMLAERAK